MRDAAKSLDKDAVTVTCCNKGRPETLHRIFCRARGFRKVYNLSGGAETIRYNAQRKIILPFQERAGDILSMMKTKTGRNFDEDLPVDEQF